MSTLAVDPDYLEVSILDVRPRRVRVRRPDGVVMTTDPDNSPLVEEWLDGDALRFYIHVDDTVCHGHETTSGAIGSVTYCDGSCRGSDARFAS